MNISRQCALLCLTGHLCFCQDLCDIPKLRASTEASAALDRIIVVVGFNPGSVLLYESSDAKVKQKGGAMSLACNIATGTERWIVYDPNSIMSDLARDFVFAHETAHHINFQPLLGMGWSKEQELEADYYAAEYLTRMNWDKKKLLDALDQLNLPVGSQGGYPSLEERQARVIKGYTDESARIGRLPPRPLVVPPATGQPANGQPIQFYLFRTVQSGAPPIRDDWTRGPMEVWEERYGGEVVSWIEARSDTIGGCQGWVLERGDGLAVFIPRQACKTLAIKVSRDEKVWRYFGSMQDPHWRESK